MKGVNVGGKNVTSLRYAHDTALLAETPEILQKIIDTVNEAGQHFGMKINAKRTMVMTVSRAELASCETDGVQIEEVKSFTYLGEMVTPDGNNETEIQRRIGIAKGTFNKMNSILSGGDIYQQEEAS